MAANFLKVRGITVVVADELCWHSQGRRGFEVRLLCCLSALNGFKLVNGHSVLINSWSVVSRNYHITGTNLDSIKKEVGRTNAVSIWNWVKADNKSEPFSIQMSIVSRLGSSLADCSGDVSGNSSEWLYVNVLYTAYEETRNRCLPPNTTTYSTRYRRVCGEGKRMNESCGYPKK